MYTMLLQEAIVYYNTNDSPVHCTFTDATKAYDEVNYCKLKNY